MTRLGTNMLTNDLIGSGLFGFYLVPLARDLLVQMGTLDSFGTILNECFN